MKHAAERLLAFSLVFLIQEAMHITKARMR